MAPFFPRQIGGIIRSAFAMLEAHVPTVTITLCVVEFLVLKRMTNVMLVSAHFMSVRSAGLSFFELFIKDMATVSPNPRPSGVLNFRGNTLFIAALFSPFIHGFAMHSLFMQSHP